LPRVLEGHRGDGHRHHCHWSRRGRGRVHFDVLPKNAIGFEAHRANSKRYGPDTNTISQGKQGIPIDSAPTTALNSAAGQASNHDASGGVRFRVMNSSRSESFHRRAVSTRRRGHSSSCVHSTFPSVSVSTPCSSCVEARGTEWRHLSSCASSSAGVEPSLRSHRPTFSG